MGYVSKDRGVVSRGCACLVALAAVLIGPSVVSGGADEAPGGGAKPELLMTILSEELAYEMTHLAAPDGTRPYFLSYAVYDEKKELLAASLGAVTQDRSAHERKLNIEVRVGDYELDSTHQLRGGGSSHVYGSGNFPLPLDDNADAIKHELWYHTDAQFKNAVKRMAKVRTNLKVKVDEEDKSADFSREEAHVYHEAPAKLAFDRSDWTRRLRKLSAVAREFPLVYNSTVTVGSHAGTRYLVSSEGARLQTAELRYRITLSAGAKAEDGMDLWQSVDFNAAALGGLPSDIEIEAAFRDVIAQVLALRKAPLAEPYIGPAILRNRASAVFFHEIFGHRIEGHRQKDVTEGQTFTKRIGTPVLPEFISVRDDPTARRLGSVDLRGFYRYDDEGVRAADVTLVDSGVLRTFLMSRKPVEGFPQSNGHGRREAGDAAVSRQANLIVESDRAIPFEALRKQLIEVCKRQDKPYGLLFEDISGGFTTTSRQGPQSFKVLPIVVYKVFADGRPDELIRGADIVGTPLTCFERITHTGDDPGVFNGSCGAESGWVPVSAISPSILVSTIEIEKRTRSQSRPPILSPPLAEAP